MTRGNYEATPVSSLAEVLLAVLEKGIVVAIRLVGPPGDRRLLVGLGTPESIDPLLLALGMTSGVFTSRYDEHGWME